tara:strand:+ start:4502 stop:5398 length:897 start_codon:yes stop_codon:yes gene_type:complete
MVFNLIKEYLPFRSSWALIFSEIAVVAIFAGAAYESGYVSLIIFFTLMAFFLIRFTSVLISIAFAILFLNYALTLFSHFVGMPIDKLLSLMTSNLTYQIGSTALILIITYKHIKSSILLRLQITQLTAPILSRRYIKVPSFRTTFRNKPQNINVSFEGTSLNKKRVKAYTYKTLNYLIPDNQKHTNINIKEVQTIDNNNTSGGIRAEGSKTAGRASRHGNDINIQIANITFGQRTFEEKMITLAHELVHAKQFIFGELQFGKWKGTPEEDYYHMPYAKTPWEFEAYGLQDFLYKKFWK